MGAHKDFEALAGIFSRAYADTGNIADALRVYEALRNAPTIDIEAVRLNDIVVAVAHRHNLRTRDLFGPRRDKKLHAARTECWWLLRQRNLSMEAIGAAFRRHYTCVSDGVRAFEQRLDASAELRAETHWLLSQFQRPRQAA